MFAVGLETFLKAAKILMEINFWILSETKSVSKHKALRGFPRSLSSRRYFPLGESIQLRFSWLGVITAITNDSCYTPS